MGKREGDCAPVSKATPSRDCGEPAEPTAFFRKADGGIALAPLRTTDSVTIRNGMLLVTGWFVYCR